MIRRYPVGVYRRSSAVRLGSLILAVGFFVGGMILLILWIIHGICTICK
jgi:hypothetical protein